MKTLLLISLISFGASAQTMKAGMWRNTPTLRVLGIPWSTKSKTRCFKPNEVEDIKATVRKFLSKNNCNLTSWRLRAGRVAADIKCNGPEIIAEGRMEGEASDTHFALSATIENGSYHGVDASYASLEYEGEWLGPCSE